MFVKKAVYIMGFSLLAFAAQAKTPTTQATVFHPVTDRVVTRPQTDAQAAVLPPQTTAIIQRPVTQAPVLKPVTTTAVNQLRTEVAVSHPQTYAVVNHPTTVEFETADSAGGTLEQKSSKNSMEKAVNSVPSSSSPTTMSGFQMPKAKDFKAANLTKGEDGLGKPNDAEKNASAAAFQVPKADEASAENLKSIAEKAQSLNKATLEKQIESKTSK